MIIQISHKRLYLEEVQKLSVKVEKAFALQMSGITPPILVKRLKENDYFALGVGLILEDGDSITRDQISTLYDSFERDLAPFLQQSDRYQVEILAVKLEDSIRGVGAGTTAVRHST